MPKDTFTHSATTPVSRSEAWIALDSPSTWEAIGGIDRIYDAVHDDEGRLQGFSFESLVGGVPYRGNATPHERVEGERMAWVISSSEVRGITTVALSDDSTGTNVAVTVEVRSAGMLGSMFFGAIAGALRRGLPPAVEDFAARLAEPDPLN